MRVGIRWREPVDRLAKFLRDVAEDLEKRRDGRRVHVHFGETETVIRVENQPVAPPAVFRGRA